MGDALLCTVNGAYMLETENILDLAGQIIASKRFSNAPAGQADEYFFYHNDIRGSVLNIVDKTGNRIKNYDYDEYGKITADSQTFKNDVAFTGSVYDSATGLQYMNARYYNPETGRFLTQDTYTGNALDPATQHLYSYCGNNPINMIDPTGHDYYDPNRNGTNKNYTPPGITPKPKDNSNVKYSPDSIMSPNPRLKNAPDLNTDTTPKDLYNCWGDASGKQTIEDPIPFIKGYDEWGQPVYRTVEEMYIGVKVAFGPQNVQRLSGIDGKIDPGWYRVALRVGVDDYHFITQKADGRWHNKSGKGNEGVYVSKSKVTADTWYSMKPNSKGEPVKASSFFGPSYYTGPIIYFAVNGGWAK